MNWILSSLEKSAWGVWSSFLLCTYIFLNGDGSSCWETEWWAIRMLLPLAILLLRVWSINYVQLFLRQTHVLWSKERSNITHQSWNRKYHQKFLCYCTFVKSLFFYSKVEFLWKKCRFASWKQPYVHWKLFCSAVNKEAVEELTDVLPICHKE